MKAAIVETPNRLVVRDVPEPPRENACQARCEILFGATCTGTDLHIISNTLPWETPYPCVLGHESVGRIVEVGPGVRNYNVGDLIHLPACDKVPGYGSSWGGFAELAWVTDFDALRAAGEDVQGVNKRVLPADLDPAAATMLLTWCEGYAYVKAMEVGAGASCLLLGSGGNGFAFAAAARALGAGRIVMAGSAAREAAARAVGVTQFLDYKDGDLKARLKQACPEGYDFVVDVVGAGAFFDEAAGLIRRGATLGVYGLDDGFASVLKPWLKPSFKWFDGGKDPDAVLEEVVGLMQQGCLDATHWMDVEHPRPLEEIAQVYEKLRLRTSPYPKAVIRLRG